MLCNDNNSSCGRLGCADMKGGNTVGAVKRHAVGSIACPCAGLTSANGGNAEHHIPGNSSLCCNEAAGGDENEAAKRRTRDGFACPYTRVSNADGGNEECHVPGVCRLINTVGGAASAGGCAAKCHAPGSSRCYGMEGA